MARHWRATQLALLQRLPPRWQSRLLWEKTPPADRWQSWDAMPWRHPWLSPANLRAMRDYSAQQHQRWLVAATRLPTRACRYAFVGNLANNLYMRAQPLRERGAAIDVFLHPDDHYVMGNPAWEESDTMLEQGETDTRALLAAGVPLKTVPGVYQIPSSGVFDTRDPTVTFRSWRVADLLRFPEYLPFKSTIDALRSYDALLAAQVPYLAYFAGRPYAATQCGGDIWYDCSRGDKLGLLQRRAYAHAAVYLASNPWSFAHARRYGMHHFVYLPLILNDRVYRPAESLERVEWERRTGGKFFVFSSVRQNDTVKGTQLAIQGFAEFARERPDARLVVTTWGQDTANYPERYRALGIADKVLALPIVGKQRMISYLQAADCMLDQFVIGYYGASALEAMACGLPTLMRTEASQYDALCEGGAPPTLNASTAAEICSHLRALMDDHGTRQRLGERSRDWFLANHSAARWTPVYEALLMLLAADTRFSFGDSPLCAPLGRDERDYHAHELATAPRFPNYQ